MFTGSPGILHVHIILFDLLPSSSSTEFISALFVTGKLLSRMFPFSLKCLILIAPSVHYSSHVFAQ